jgi:hypothetical protein
MVPGTRVRFLPSAFCLEVPPPKWFGTVVRLDVGWALVRLDRTAEAGGLRPSALPVVLDWQRPPAQPEVWEHTDHLSAVL